MDAFDNPVAALKAAARVRRARVREQCVYVDGAGTPDPMIVEAKFTQDGRRLTVRASNSWFWIETRTDTALLFSVGTPNRWWASESVDVLEGRQLPLFRPSNIPFAASRETLLAWLAEPANRALIEGLRLEQPEAVHIARNGLWMILRGDRVLDDGLFRIVVSLAAALETAPPAPEPPAQWTTTRRNWPRNSRGFQVHTGRPLLPRSRSVCCPHTCPSRSKRDEGLRPC